MGSPAGHHEVRPGVVPAPDMPLSREQSWAIAIMFGDPIRAEDLLDMEANGFTPKPEYKNQIVLGPDNCWHFPAQAFEIPREYRNLPDPRACHIGQRR